MNAMKILTFLFVMLANELAHLSRAEGQQFFALDRGYNLGRPVRSEWPAAYKEDYHTNVDSDQINERPKYDLIPTISSSWPSNTGKFVRLFSNIITMDPSIGRKMKTQLDKKRGLRLRDDKEDKDYSFVISPTSAQYELRDKEWLNESPWQNSLSFREKRRRCKLDRNLGVKNAAFCDTDAYFGAADYMRDVWDSAGRR